MNVKASARDKSRMRYGFESAPIQSQVGVLFNRSKVVHVRASGFTTLVMVPRKAFALMFEFRGEMRMKLCTALVDLTHTKIGRSWSGIESIEDEEMTKIEAQAITDLAAHSVDARRRKQEVTLANFVTSLESFRGKDEYRRKRDKAVLNLTEHLRLACSVPWESSPFKPAVRALAIWRLNFKSKRQLSTSKTSSHNRREMMRDGFSVIERSWSIVANDTKLIYSTHLLSLKEYLGEVGVQFFDQVQLQFLISKFPFGPALGLA